MQLTLGSRLSDSTVLKLLFMNSTTLISQASHFLYSDSCPHLPPKDIYLIGRREARDFRLVLRSNNPIKCLVCFHLSRMFLFCFVCLLCWFLAALGVHCCAWATLVAVPGLLIAFASCCRALAPEHGLSSYGWRIGLVAPWHVESFWTRDRTHVPCIGKWILNHWTTREVHPECF